MSDQDPTTKPPSQPEGSDERTISVDATAQGFLSQDQPSSELPIPERIGRYAVERLLGSGGFGRVFLAVDERLDKRVAIKLAKPEQVGKKSIEEAYLAEARNLAKLEHPNIVQVFDVLTDDGLPYIVMKYVDGVTLDEWVRSESPTIQEVVGKLVPVCDALGFAHRHDLVHRDLKPSNILIDKNGQAFVTDFGLALPLSSRGKWHGRVAGTLPYMSPEQVRGEAHRIDGRSDIWSLGVVLYEQLADARPFSAENLEGLLEEIVTGEPPPPRQRNPQTSSELERICLKCLSTRRSERYSTIADLSAELKRWLDSPELQSTTDTVRLTTVDESSSLLSGVEETKFVPRGLRAFTKADAAFFLDLLPGPRDHSGLPESVAFWKHRIERTDPTDTFSVGLIYGPSGCGKSSLVQAGLIPRISQNVTSVYVEATADATEGRIRRAIQDLFPQDDLGSSLPQVFARLRSVNSAHLGPQSSIASRTDSTFELRSRPPGKVVLLIDQFEQWLHAYPDLPETDLIPALRHCDGCGLQAVLMVRDDFAMAAARFMRALDIPILQGVNFSTVDLFDIKHAEKILKRFGQAYDRVPDHDRQVTSDQRKFITQAVEDLSTGGTVVPVQLTLFAEMVKSRTWAPETLESLGGATGIGVKFLDETFCSRTANPRYRLQEKAARGVLRALLPDVGADIKRNMQPREQLQLAAGYEDRPNDFEELLTILDSELRLITPTDPDESGEPDSTSWNYQLAHDYLVPSLRSWLTLRESRAERTLAERSSLWSTKPENRQLPSLPEYLSIVGGTRWRGWNPGQRRMMRTASSYYLLRCCAVALLALFATWSVFQFLHKKRAELLVTRILAADAAEFGQLRDELPTYLNAAKAQLRTAALTQPESQEATNARLLLAADSNEFTPELFRTLVSGGDEYFDLARQSLMSHAAEVAPELSRFARKGIPPNGDYPSHGDWPPDQRAHVRARAIAALLALDEGDEAIGVLADSVGDLELVAELATVSPVLVGADKAQCLITLRPDSHRNLTAEQRQFVEYASLLTLGEYDPSGIDSAERAKLEARILQQFETNSSSAIHAASGWVLRRWGKSSLVAEIERKPAPYHPDREWFRRVAQGVDLGGKPFSFSYTFVIFPPREHTLGSPATEVGHQPREDQQTVALPQKFAVLDREITNAELVCSGGPNHLQLGSAAAVGASWYDAVRFCRWLTGQIGMSESQQAYLDPASLDPSEFPASMEEIAAGAPENWPLNISNGGIRLPIEAEWEVACRGGSPYAYCFGDNPTLLKHYGWMQDNAGSRPGTREPRLKRPNFKGMFDMHGNVYEWCHDPVLVSAMEPIRVTGFDAPIDRPILYRADRGGWKLGRANVCRAAYRSRAEPIYRGQNLGFRIAMTVPSQDDGDQ